MLPCRIPSTDVSFVYNIDPPSLISKSILLLLSLREHYPDIKIYPYVRADRYHDIPEIIHTIHNRHQAPIQTLDFDLTTDPIFAQPYYPHGNKLLAVAQERLGRYCIFFDTDTYLAKKLDFTELFFADKISAVPEGVAGFAGRHMQHWEHAYGLFNLDIPQENVAMLRTGRITPPYYNAGFVAFPEYTPDGQHFGKLWLDTALKMDYAPETHIDNRRPWLDQGALPISVYRANMRFNTLDSIYNYSIDGDYFLFRNDVKLFHYHSFTRIEAGGLQNKITQTLQNSGHFSSWDEFAAPRKFIGAKSALTFKKIEPIREHIAKIQNDMKEIDPETSPKNRARWKYHKRQIKQLQNHMTQIRAQRHALKEADFFPLDWGLTAMEKNILYANDKAIA